MSTIPPTRRRWFRFSLATMFVVVTLLAVRLGYQANWVRQRHEVIARAVRAKKSPGSGGQVAPPGALWLFQEPGYHLIALAFQDRGGGTLLPSEIAEIERVKLLFPEAKVAGIPIPERLLPMRPPRQITKARANSTMIQRVPRPLVP
ncbi:MAG TPA: hypothetical protein VGN12_02310 [Pirellulales bacterium]|jgi:hypothetical protein